MDLNLTIKGKIIRPSYIESDYSVNISFDLVDPVLQLQQRQLGLQEVQAGLKSMETYWSSDARLEDASGERKRLLMDWVRKNPMIHQALAMEVAKEEGIESLVERALSMAQGGEEGGGAGAAPILGPDGMPMDQTMGQDQLRQGLTPNTINPSQIGANMAG